MGKLADLVSEVLPDAVTMRHDLHAHPELGYQEKRTSEVVKRELDKLGITHKGGLAKGTGVLAYIPATKDGGSTIALRADMDALPITENTGASYQSTNPGVMHACGHDGHTTILLTAAKVLSKLESRPNDILLMFQPAEEGGAGGKFMCEDGVLQGRVLGRKADMVYGLHGFPVTKVGHVSTRIGPLMAAASEFSIKIRGKGSHAAQPHLGFDPIVVGSHIVAAIQTIASRNVSPLDSVVVTIGVFKAGVAHNVIPDEAYLRGTLRTLKSDTDDMARQRLAAIVEGVATGFGATASLEFGPNPYPVVINHPEATERFQAIARKTIGEALVHEETQPVMGGEDFAFYGREVPACFFWLGLLPADQTRYPNLHAPEFDFNDDAIATGVHLMCELALNPL